MNDQPKWRCDTTAMDMFYRILPELGYEPYNDGDGRRWVRTQDIKTTTEITLDYLAALQQSYQKGNIQ